jgi:hypothetical protein
MMTVVAAAFYIRVGSLRIALQELQRNEPGTLRRVPTGHHCLAGHCTRRKANHKVLARYPTDELAVQFVDAGASD